MSDTSARRAPLISAGIRDMIIAAFFFSLMGVIVKYLGRRLPSQEMVFARSFVALVLSYWVIRRRGLSPWGHDIPRLAMRGLLGFAALSCFFYALTKLTLADAMVIQFTNPILAMFLAAIFLGERVGGRELAAGIAALFGVVLVARPPFLFDVGVDPPDPFALALAVAGSIGAAIVYVTIRKLRATDEPIVIVFWFPLIATPLSIPTMMPHALWPTAWELLLLVAMGVCVQIAQVHMTRGLHREPAGRATAISYLQVALAFIWGVVFFGEIPPWTSVAGATLIVGSVVAVAVSKEQEADTPEEPTAA